MRQGIFVFLVCLLVWNLAALPALSQDSPAPEQVLPESAGSALPTQGSLTQGSLTAYTLPEVTVYGLADQPPSTPVTTSFGTQFNVVTEEQISRQGALDFYDALRNVPGVMYRKSNIIGGQTSHSLYIRGRGASHPSPDLNIYFDDVPRSGVLYGQALADGIPVYALGGMEIYKYPQPSRFGSGYGMVNFIPKYMAEEGQEARFGFEGGSYATFAENVGLGMKKGVWDIYAAQSLLSTEGHVAHSGGWQESYYLNTGLQLGEHWSLRFMGNYVYAETDKPNTPLTRQRGSPRRFDTETSLTTLTLSNTYADASGYVKGYYNNTNFWLVGETSGGVPNAATSRQSNDLWGLRARETFSLWEGSEIVAGFDLDRMDLANEQRFRDNRSTVTWNFPDQTVFSPYAAVSQFLGSEDGFHLIPSAGLRLYSNSVFEDKAAPQAGLILGYAHTDLNFNYARGVNYPSPVILQNYLGNASLPSSLDTEEIRPEIVDHYELGLTHTWPGLARLSGTFFYDRGRDRTRAYMYGNQPSSVSFFNSSASRYRIRGLELAGSLTPLEGLELFAGATWLRAKAVGDDGLERDRMPYTPDFALQTGFSWKFHENFRLSGDYQHLQGVYDGTAARTTNPAAPASDFSRLTKLNKLKDIDVVNLRLDYLFSYEPLALKEGKLFFAVDNVFDADYAYTKEVSATDSASYWMPGTTFMLGLELKF
ncbi:MAG: TonB-dependent receptor plug domain-containing protein [Desulfovibrio sp.]|jgi:iron complex outermembrane receptor protein|nr:TonB-dependent receptor plug domain-containing protein [Desulfovibrio sp.]